MSDTRPAVDHVADHAVVFLTGEVDLAVEGEVLEAYRDAIGLMDRPPPRSTCHLSADAIERSGGRGPQ
jgi:hypothetical protein